MQGIRQDGYGDAPCMFAQLYLVPDSQYKCTYHIIVIISRKTRKLDCLKVNSKGVTNEKSTCTVPIHTPQTNSFVCGACIWEVNSACEV